MGFDIKNIEKVDEKLFLIFFYLSFDPRSSPAAHFTAKSKISNNFHYILNYYSQVWA